MVHESAPNQLSGNIALRNDRKMSGIRTTGKKMGAEKWSNEQAAVLDYWKHRPQPHFSATHFSANHYFPAPLHGYIRKSIMCAKIFRLRVCSVCPYLLLWRRAVRSRQCGLWSMISDNCPGITG